MRRLRALLTVVALSALAWPALGQECDELVIVTPGPGSVEISHRQSAYNCCCEIEFNVSQEGLSICVDEYEVLLEGGCDCLCCFDAEILIEGLEEGEYELLIVKHTEYSGTEIVGSWTVTVTGESAQAVWTTYVPCAETGSAEEGMTWGVIKALYR